MTFYHFNSVFKVYLSPVFILSLVSLFLEVIKCFIELGFVTLRSHVKYIYNKQRFCFSLKALL